MKFPVCLCLTSFLTVIAAARAQPPGRVNVQETVRRGLEWLAGQQDKTDGHFAANQGQYPTSMTALAGMCFLLEGSTPREGSTARTSASASTGT